MNAPRAAGPRPQGYLSRQSGGLLVLRALVALAALLAPFSARAAEIVLNLTQETFGSSAEVAVRNDSAIDVEILGIEVELDGAVYVQRPDDSRWRLRPGDSLRRHFELRLPEIPGSYPQRVTVRYLNEGRAFSLNGVAYLHRGGEALLASDARLHDAEIRHEGDLTLAGADAGDWRVLLPEELTVLDDTLDGSTRTIRVRANRPGFVTNYPVYATRSAISNGRHQALVVAAEVRVDDSPGAMRGRLSNGLLVALLFAAAPFFLFLWEHDAGPGQPWKSALGKYAARVFWIAAGYVTLKNADAFFDLAARWAESLPVLHWHLAGAVAYLPSIPENPVASILYLLRDNLRGDNYAYFFQWFIDPYFAVCSVLCLFYSRFLDAERSLYRDKYAAALALVLFARRKPDPPSQGTAVEAPPFLPPAKLGFLAIGVKLFFLPYLTSWLINNLIHQWNLSVSFSFSFGVINQYLLALFLLVDSAIFAFGYAFESRQLKSELRSVEPTLLGWAVCLWCYPPFNAFSFQVFDYPLFGIYVDPPTWMEPVVLALVTLCWGVFAWASVALGFKASNLTNRGIVSHGPYRWCRHPAYAAKMLAWTIEGVFLGQYYVGLLLGFLVIYGLRAWTEERHLSRDPDYREYKRRVPYWFIPGVI